MVTVPSTRARGLAALTCALALAACAETTSPEGSTSVTLSVAATTPATQATSTARMTSPPGSLLLTRVAMVIREVELKRATTQDCEDSVSGGDDDDCEEFEVGPFLLEIPVDGGVTQVLSVSVPAATYDELEFEIHKPDDDDSGDLTFVQQNPDFAEASIRVEGTFDGEAFVFLQDLDVEQETDLSPPLVVEDGASPINLTLLLDVSGWFVTADGSVIDPRTANKGGDNEGVVEENIKRSIEVFEDDDHDGHR